MKDYTGLKFNRLTAVSYDGLRDSSNKRLWTFQCDCGEKTSARFQSVKSGHTKSCGCYAKERMSGNTLTKTHGMTNHKFYRTWVDMKGRCGTHKNYLNIRVCAEWEDFNTFKSDMYKTYQKAVKRYGKTSIDRINNEEGYSKDNCRWATQKTQMNNMTRNRIIKYKGKSKTLTQWAEQYGLLVKTLQERLNKGLTIHRALTLPLRDRSNRWYQIK